MMTSTTKNKSILLINKPLKIVFSLTFVCSVWWIAALILNDSFILPSPLETMVSLFKIVADSSFATSVFTSIFRVVLGLIIGTFLGVAAATLSYFFEIFDMLISPVISIMKATPVASIIILLWISMNYMRLTVFVVVLMIMPIIWQNVLNGYRAVDKGLSEVALVFEFSFAKKFKILILPSLVEFLIPALITSVGMAWKAEIAAEIMVCNNIGKLIYDYKTVSYDTASIFAWTVIIVSFSIILEFLTKTLLKRIKYRAGN